MATDISRRPSSRPLAPADEVHELPQPDDFESTLDALIVREALDTLSPAHREVLRMADLQGLTPPQIAERLDLPVGMVKKRHFHAMRALRAALKERGLGPGAGNRPELAVANAIDTDLPVNDPGASAANAPRDLQYLGASPGLIHSVTYQTKPPVTGEYSFQPSRPGPGQFPSPKCPAG